MEDFLLYLTLLEAVLVIILFVKIWSMTSDVRELRDRICRNEGTVKSKFADYYLCGEYEEAYKFLNHYLSGEVNKRFYNLSRNDAEYKKIYAEEIAKLVERYSPYYKLLGKDAPENIKNISYDFYDKFA